VTPLVGGLLLVAAAAAVLNWFAVWRGGPPGAALERVTKPVVMLALIGVALAWPTEPGTEPAAVRPFLVAGLVLSLVGDVLLLPPGRFVPGLVAFLMGHVAYLAAFLQLAGSAPWLAAGIVAAVVLIATVGRVLVRAAARSGLGAPVALYLVAICAMAVAATRTGEPVGILGAWLFVASDALLGWGRLRAPAPGMPRGGGRRLGVAVMITYHVAQGLLVLALVA
jgi:uncharacterized membrane protein YhhN